MFDKLNSFLKSRRFWMMVAAVVIAVGKEQIPFLQQFTDEQIQAAIFAIGAWIVGESLRSSEGPKE